MASSRPHSKLIDLDLTIISAKHLKNVNWRHGDLKPYVAFWIEPGCRFTTKPDEFGSTRPVWNEQFTIPLKLPLQDALLSLEVTHSESSTAPLVGTLQLPLKDLVNSDDSNLIRTLELRRPSGRPQGKIRLRLAVRERPAPPSPDYLPPNYYYSSAPPPPPTRDYRGYPQHPYSSLVPPPAPYTYGGYADPYPGYYSGYYSSAPPPPPPPRPFFERSSSYAGPSRPSAPVDYSSYDHKPKGSKMGLGAGLAIGAVAGALGGLALEEGLKYEEDKIADRVESDLVARDDYSDYRGDY